MLRILGFAVHASRWPCYRKDRIGTIISLSSLLLVVYTVILVVGSDITLVFSPLLFLIQFDEREFAFSCVLRSKLLSAKKIAEILRGDIIALSYEVAM